MSHYCDSDEEGRHGNSLKSSKTIINLKQITNEKAACMDSIIKQPRQSSPRPTTEISSKNTKNSNNNNEIPSQQEQISNTTTTTSFTDSRQTSSSSPLRQG